MYHNILKAESRWLRSFISSCTSDHGQIIRDLCWFENHVLNGEIRNWSYAMRLHHIETLYPSPTLKILEELNPEMYQKTIKRRRSIQLTLEESKLKSELIMNDQLEQIQNTIDHYKKKS